MKILGLISISLGLFCMIGCGHGLGSNDRYRFSPLERGDGELPMGVILDGKTGQYWTARFDPKDGGVWLKGGYRLQDAK